MIYLKYDLATGHGLGLRKQSSKAPAPENSEAIGYLLIEEELNPQEWTVDLGTLSLTPRVKDSAEIDAENMPLLRAARDQKLAACDWRVVVDSPLSEAQKQEWMVYRQALRDLPSTIQGPLLSLEDVVWPSEPG
jgi:hypothetical protein